MSAYIINKESPADSLALQYTCPTCRDKVCSRPIQNFAVKGLVRAVAGQIGETSPQKKTVDAANVWSRFFPAQ
jgi:hypothetical protein